MSDLSEQLSHRGGACEFPKGPVAGRAQVYELHGASGYAIAGPNRELYWQGGVEQDDGSGVTEIHFPIIPTSLPGAACH
ncbi:MAG: hypothetical protein L0Y75_04470 [Acidobacteria bacterium]|nr:hypothetical protein [Acidobacteriota bacterium]